MGCSSSKLEPEEKVAMAAAEAAEPSTKATTGRRGFGCGGRKNNKAGGRGRGGKQQKQQEQEARKGGGGSGSELLSRSPGSPSFRYYCDEVVVVMGVADEHKEKEPQ